MRRCSCEIPDPVFTAIYGETRSDGFYARMCRRCDGLVVSS